MVKIKFFLAVLFLILGNKIFSQIADFDFSDKVVRFSEKTESSADQTASSSKQSESFAKQSATSAEQTASSSNQTESSAKQTASSSKQSATSAEQESEEYSGEKVKQNWQILNWEDDSFAVLKFDVEIQKYNSENKTWQTVRLIKLSDNSTSIKLEPQLKPGTYRYRFIPYNFFGLKDEEVDFEHFTIYESFLPEVRNLVVNRNMTSIIYLDELNDGIFSVSGRNLFSVKKSDSDFSFTQYFLQGQTNKNFFYIPQLLTLQENSRTAEFYLDLEKLDVGSYYFVARDASGLESEKSNRTLLQIRFKKLIDFDISLFYALPIVLFDDTFRTYFSSSIFPFSAGMKFSFLPFKRRFGYFGLGISSTYSRMNYEEENYLLSGNLITAHLNFVYQVPLKILDKKLNQKKHLATLEIHSGGGASYFCDYKFYFPHEIVSEPLNSLNISFLLGGALQIYFWRRFFAELNFDYVQSFVSDMNFGMIVPSLSFGWQF